MFQFLQDLDIMAPLDVQRNFPGLSVSAGHRRRWPMAILLDHLIVPSRRPVASARSLATLLDIPWEEARGHFTPVYLNDSLTLDFAERDQFASHHYCFRVSDAEFDQILARVQAAGIKYRSSP